MNLITNINELVDKEYEPKPCPRCDRSCMEPEPTEFETYAYEADPVPCRLCLGNGVLYPEAEYSDRTGKFLGFNYP